MNSVLLEFDSALRTDADGKELRDGLSVVAQIGNQLWVASDESASLESLSTTDGRVFKNHRTHPLANFLDLPSGDAQQEVDIEGLAYDDGYLWLIGSHSLKRKQPKEEAGGNVAKDIARLARVEDEGNRYLLARVPLVQSSDGLYEPRYTHQASRGRRRTATAARLDGDENGNALTKALKGDEHLGAFLNIPGKDNGFDIEGLAVAGDRFFVGLRGPVLRGWSMILEIEIEEKRGTLLRLRKIGADKRLYKKHFLQLGGLGVRELCVQGRSLLILAGPTMDLDGPVAVYRWRDALDVAAESLVGKHRLEKVFDVPYGQGADAGKDHAEGMTMFSRDGSDTPSVLLAYDAPADARKVGARGVMADVFAV